MVGGYLVFFGIWDNTFDGGEVVVLLIRSDIEDVGCLGKKLRLCVFVSIR